MIAMNWTTIGLNWTVLFKCLEMAFVGIWRFINKLNWIEKCYHLYRNSPHCGTLLLWLVFIQKSVASNDKISCTECMLVIQFWVDGMAHLISIFIISKTSSSQVYQWIKNRLKEVILTLQLKSRKGVSVSHPSRLLVLQEATLKTEGSATHFSPSYSGNNR